MSLTSVSGPAVSADVAWEDAFRGLFAAGDHPSLLVAGSQPALVAQPIVDLSAGVVVGYELLSRFAGPPTAPPDVWFAEADRLGYAGRLTAAVITRALSLVAGAPANTFVTVNVEPHLLTDPAVHDALHATGRLDRVVVELTEHVRAPDEQGLRAALDAIRSAGGLIAIDDAGTGYAGLQLLLTIRPDIVKLDRELIAGIDTDPARRALVQLFGDLTGRMDAWLLAEGVETVAELQALVSLGVPLGQGWALGRPGEPWPVLAEEVTARLRLLTLRASLSGHVAPLVRVCPTVPLPLGGTVSDSAPGTVVIDAARRPLGVVAALPGGGGTWVAPAMTVAPSSTPVEVLRRALGRPPTSRGIAIVCTDQQGALIGTIDVADLAEAVIAVPAPSTEGGEHR